MTEIKDEMLEAQAQPPVQEAPATHDDLPTLKEGNRKNRGKFGEWMRKRIVKLKRKPQSIFLVFLALVTVYNLLTLSTYSEYVINAASGIDWVGLLVFVNTLLSILVLVSALGMYPKLRKKGSKVVLVMEEKGSKLNVNMFMFAVTVAMLALMIMCECFYLKIVNANPLELTADNARSVYVRGLSLSFSIAHLIMLGIATLLMFALPLYRKLIMMIDTSIVLESATENMQEIDLQD